MDLTTTTTSTHIDPKAAALLCVVITIPLLLIQQLVLQPKTKKSSSSIPDATNAVPGLGNALEYKEDPPGCIRAQQDATKRKVFRLNLAGRKMVIVGSCPVTMKHVASQPESVLSSCRAVAEIGFEYTMGHFNVYEGTAWHKAILKNHYMGDKLETVFLPRIYKALEHATEREMQLLLKDNTTTSSTTTTTTTGPDLFPFVRQCFLRAILDEFVSPRLLANHPSLLQDCMIFQDKVEDATAKAAVLPRFLALPLCLWPTQAARRQLQQSLAAILQQEIWNRHGSKDSMGPWAQTYLEDGTSPERAAEHLIGLIFAGHKNPSIGAGQSLCFVRTELSSEQQQCATQEARQLCESFGNKQKLTQALLNATTLRACVLETMRVTAHTLGAIRYAESAVQLPGEMVIEAGETVSLAHHAMHMESSLWGENPSQFSLDRWQQHETTNESSLGIPVDHYKLTTFSNGLHKCPGEKVALAMMELWLAIMLTRDAQLVGDLPPVSFERATLAQREGPVGFSVRSSSSS